METIENSPKIDETEVAPTTSDIGKLKTTGRGLGIYHIKMSIECMRKEMNDRCDNLIAALEAIEGKTRPNQQI